MNVFNWWDADDYMPWGPTGSAHAVSSDDPDRDRVQELREVVAEITGIPMAEKPHMGFI